MKIRRVNARSYNETKRNLINRFYDYTEPGGYLLIGHSESMNRSESKYEFVAPAIYRRG